MIPYFRKIRKQFADNNKPVKYMRYAIGEIVLVVVGILIALSINNWNEKNKTRNRELIYLSNIKEDLKLNIASLGEFISARKETLNAVDTLIGYFEGKRDMNLNKFNFYNLTVLEWYPFVQHSNTYQELMNSGTFAIISNKSIKNSLQNIQSIYGSITFIENEMQQDYERYLYEPYFNLVDLNSTLKNYIDQKNNKVGDLEEVNIAEINILLKNKLYKNGLILANFNSNNLLEEYTNVIERSDQLIYLIDIELELK